MLNVDHLQSEEGQSTLPVMQTMLEIVQQGNLFPAFRFTWMASWNPMSVVEERNAGWFACQIRQLLDLWQHVLVYWTCPPH